MSRTHTEHVFHDSVNMLLAQNFYGKNIFIHTIQSHDDNSDRDKQMTLFVSFTQEQHVQV